MRSVPWSELMSVGHWIINKGEECTYLVGSFHCPGTIMNEHWRRNMGEGTACTITELALT